MNLQIFQPLGDKGWRLARNVGQSRYLSGPRLESNPVKVSQTSLGLGLVQIRVLKIKVNQGKLRLIKVN